MSKSHALVQGASRGIGLAFVRELLVDGERQVIATCRDPKGESANELAELSAKHPDRFRVVGLDVTDESSIARAAQSLSEEVGSIDLLINSAGILHKGNGMRPERRLAAVKPEHVLECYRVNALGPLLMAKHFERYFLRRERVVLANLSARVGSIGDNHLGGWYAYRASKVAQNMMTRNLSIELRRRYKGVICVALHPGTVDTELSRPFQKNVPSERLFTPQRAARQLLEVVGGLTLENHGGFFAWDGQTLPW